MSKIKLPPPFYLMAVLDHCPLAGSTYVQLWNNKNSESKLYVAHKDINFEYLKSKTKFRHDLLLLVKEGLISVEETKDKIYIEVTAWEDIVCRADEDFLEC